MKTIINCTCLILFMNLNIQAQDTIHVLGHDYYLVGSLINSMKEGLWKKFQGDSLIGEHFYNNNIIMTEFTVSNGKRELISKLSEDKHLAITFSFSKNNLLKKEIFYSKNKEIDLENLGELLYSFIIYKETYEYYSLDGDSIKIKSEVNICEKNKKKYACIRLNNYYINNELIFEFVNNNRLVFYNKELFEKHSEFFLENDLFLRLMLIK